MKKKIKKMPDGGRLAVKQRDPFIRSQSDILGLNNLAQRASPEDLSAIQRLGINLTGNREDVNKAYDIYNKLVDYTNNPLTSGGMSPDERAIRTKIANSVDFGYPKSINDVRKVMNNITSSPDNSSRRPDKKGISNNTQDLRHELIQQYLGINDNPKYLTPSQYKPTKGSDKNANYQDFNDSVRESMMNGITDFGSMQAAANRSKIMNSNKNAPGGGSANLKSFYDDGDEYGALNQLGSFTMNTGKDQRGDYVSYYDNWDLNPKMLKDKGIDLNRVNKPFEIYGRIYKGEMDSLKANSNIEPSKVDNNSFQPWKGPVTTLNPTEEKGFNNWRSKLPQDLQYDGNYDLRGLYKENPNAVPSANMHFPDTYKLPNHPTFSNQSKYFNDKTKDYAGQWQETDSSWNYIPYNPKVKDTVVEKKKMPNGGKISSKDQEAVDWTKEYINSPKYNERLGKFYQYPDYIQKQRLQGVDNIDITHNTESTKGTEHGSHYTAIPTPIGAGLRYHFFGYNPREQVTYYDKEMSDNNVSETPLGKQAGLVHEISHANNMGPQESRKLSSAEKKYIQDRNKYTNGAITDKDALKLGSEHDTSPEESKSDIDSIRFMMHKKGIYDASKENLTPEALKKAYADPDIKDNLEFKRATQHFEDKDLIDIMNKVATNDSTSQPIAKYGIKMNKKMPMGGVVPPAGTKKNVNMNPSQDELARVQRISELSKQWNVPTQNIYSQVKYGPKDTEGKALRDYTSFWTFDANGNIVQSTRDTYDNSVRGYSGSAMYTNKYTQPVQDNSIAGNAATMAPQAAIQKYGGSTPDMEAITAHMNGMPMAKNGIHINPANKGKFTASASKAGMSVQEFANHVMKNKGNYSATQVKRANFARNAAKWHKAEFGTDIPGYTQPYQDPAQPQPYQEDPRLATAKRKISGYFQNDPDAGWVPNDATADGADPSQDQYLTDANGNIKKSSYDPRSGDSRTTSNIKNVGQSMPNIHLSAGVAINALAGFVTKGLKKSQQIDEFSRLKRRQLTGQTYNPNAYGTGSEAIMKNGGVVSQYQLNPDQIQFLKKQGYKL